MSGMKLRESIRAPVRYGEDESETPTRSFLRPGTEEPYNEESVELEESGRPHRHKNRRPTPVQYNPNLPPAAFPSIDRPHSGPKPSTPDPKPKGNKSPKARRVSGVKSPPQSLPLRRAGPRKAVSFVPSESEDVPINQLENHFASNNMDNPIYARNVELAYMPRPGAPSSPDDMTARLDSDDDQLPDATQVLLEKIPNPTWNDLNPAMQAEIFENMREDYNYWGLCKVLGLRKEEREKIEEYVGIRNKQILRENNHLEQMRRKQRNALKNIDNSNLKFFEPPPQLVLKKVARDTTRRLVNKYTDLMMCQAHDLLKARQYLHRRGLPRHYAGNWGDSLVVLKEYEGDDPAEPDKFEWKEELKFTPPPPAVDPARAQAVQDAVDYINNIGRDAIAPASLVRRSTDQEPILDWGKYFGKRKDDLSWDTTKLRDGGIVKLNVGPQKAAAIQKYEKTGIMPQGTVFQGHMPRGVIPQNAGPQFAMNQGGLPRFVMPHRAQFTYPQGSYPQRQMPQGMPPRGQVSEPALDSPLPLEAPTETPSRVMHGGASSNGFGAGFSLGFPLPSGQQHAGPIRRVLPGDYSFKPMNHVESQARLKRHLALAHLQHIEAEAKAQAERFNYLPTHGVSGVGAGGSLSRGPPQRLAEKVEEPLSSEPFSWEEHEQTMIANADDIMKEFIYWHPPSENKEEKPEQAEEEVTERPATQTTFNDISSNTDVSADDVMLLPTRGERSSP